MNLQIEKAINVVNDLNHEIWQTGDNHTYYEVRTDGNSCEIWRGPNSLVSYEECFQTEEEIAELLKSRIIPKYSIQSP